LDANLIAFVGFSVIFVWWIVATYNGIVRRGNGVSRAWSDLIAQERQKNKIIPELEKMVGQYTALESSVLVQITELRNGLAALNANEVNVDALGSVERLSKEVLNGVRVAVEAYPDLKSSQVFLKLMNEVTQQQEHVGAAIRIFNSNVQDFNDGIQTFPNSVINSLFNNKSPVSTFTDTEAKSGFEYKPNL
jgi:LemA protein